MIEIYEFVNGPLVWVAFIVFFGGIVYRLIAMIRLVNKKEKFIFTYMSLKYSLRSIFRWLVPFATEGWKANPILTIVTFIFHICLIAVPTFLLSHIVLWEDAWNVNWGAFPDRVADALTVVVILCCVYFLIRRLTAKEVKYVTSASDYVILVIVAAPFITGFLAYHQFFEYPWVLILHNLTGEIMLMAIPFTRLSHMVFSPFTRAYMGSEFGAIRHSRDY
jgi:nitrate reductase gamma subunit